MSRIKSYNLFYATFTYGAYHFSFVKIYHSLSYLKKQIVPDFSRRFGGVFIIVPSYYAFDYDATIKYVYSNGEWSKDIDPELAAAFYKWRHR